MRHNYKGRKLGTDFSHTKAMKRSLVQALFLNDRIKTTEARAKEIRPDVDQIITWAKKGDLHSRRLAIAALGNDSELVREIFEKVEQGMFQDRNGGYTRILKLGNRKGDNAPMVIMELVTEPVAKPVKKEEESKPAGRRGGRRAKKVEEPAAEAAAETTEAAEEAPAEENPEAVEETEAAAETAEAAEAEAPAEETVEEAAPAVEEEKAE